MKRSRTLILAAAAACAVVVLAQQVSLPAPLANNLKNLQAAQGLTATLSVQEISGPESTVKITYAKPNKFRIETDAGMTVSDGTNVTTYNKSGNNYTVATAAANAAIEASMETKVWAWAAFFDKDTYKWLDGAKAGKQRTLKGRKVTEVAVSWSKPSPGTATLFVEDATGVAFGVNIKVGDKEYIVTTEDMKASEAPLDAGLFAFAAPSGATKVETLAPKADFAAVQAVFHRNCMPCHSDDERKDGIALTSYDEVMAAGIVTAGNPDGSKLVQSVAGSRATMPKNRPRLGAADVQTLKDWIKDGAKGPN